jgi:zinc/manganese transport system substrate-binding protein
MARVTFSARSRRRGVRSLGGFLAVIFCSSAFLAVAVPEVDAGAAIPRASQTKLQVVAAENFWGSITKQLAGNQAEVTSIITNPDTDPHDYEATPSDGRTIASAKYVIENGIGYDPWAQKLIDANPDSGRKVLDVGKLVGIDAGGNPHQWYSPDTVHSVIDRITADLKSLDPKNASYYDAQKSKYESNGLKHYDDLIAGIKQQYSGTPVGATESIFAPLAGALGLDLVTPENFLDAISEGTDPTAHDKATVDDQIKNNTIKVLVFNSQNATPDVKALVKAAKAKKIPVTTVTETLSPAGLTFQAWQSKQLAALQTALAKGTGS